MTYEGIHRSPEPGLTAIAGSGTFGGVFASSKGGMYGEHFYNVTSPRHLTNFELNYSIPGAWEVAMAVCDGDEALAEVIMTPDCIVADDADGERGWEAQRLRGQLAKRLGYTSVEMRDETGFSVLCLPGCEIVPMKA